MTLITSTATATTTTSSSATASPVVIVSTAVLLLFSNVDAQTRGSVLQPNAPVQVESLLQVIECLELHIAEALELVRLLVLHQAHVLHVQVLEDLRDISLNNALRQVSHESDVRRLRGQLLALSVSTVVSPNQVKQGMEWREKSVSLWMIMCTHTYTRTHMIHVSFG